MIGAAVLCVLRPCPAHCVERSQPNKSARRNHHRQWLNGTSGLAFKLHQLLRHKGYNTLRRCLRVRQNPPAYTAMGWAISFPCHCKTVMGFGSPSRILLRHLQCCLFLRNSFVWWACVGLIRERRVSQFDRSTNPRMAATYRLVAKVMAPIFFKNWCYIYVQSNAKPSGHRSDPVRPSA
jgi:hypothetical protein